MSTIKHTRQELKAMRSLDNALHYVNDTQGSTPDNQLTRDILNAAHMLTARQVREDTIPDVIRLWMAAK